MNIAIVGIGGIGGYIGAKLAQTYSGKNIHKIIFIQRGSHAQAIASKGLTYIAKESINTRPDVICEKPISGLKFDLVIFSVKSKDLGNAALQIKDAVSSETIIITTLNGVNNAKRLGSIFTNSLVLNGCIYVSASMIEPGVVGQIGGAGFLYFGKENGICSKGEEIENLLTNAGIKAKYSTDIITEVWKKFLFISSLASLTSLYDIPMGAIVAEEKIKDQWQTLLKEIVELAHTFGAKLNNEDIESAIKRAESVPFDTPTSMQLDFRSGKTPELDIFTGFVVAAAKEKAINVPLHEEVYKGLENKLSTKI